jgi:hypothetical protein
MHDEAIELDERALVDEPLDALACGPLAAVVLPGDRVGTGRGRRLLALRPELVIFFGPALHASQLSRARPFVIL